MTRVASPERAETMLEKVDSSVGVRSRAHAGAEWTAAFDLILLIGGLIILHVAVSGSIPSGGDGGNWLALARESLGENVMSTLR